MPNLGVSLDMPGGWRIRTATVDELTAADVSNPLDAYALVAMTGAYPMEMSSLGRTGLVAIRDEPPAWLDIVAHVGGRNRETLVDQVMIDTPAGPAAAGSIESAGQDVPAAVAYVDVPAGDWDLAVTGRVGTGATEAPMDLLAPVLASLTLSGAPATTGKELKAPRSDAPAPDPVLEAWFPASLAGAPATVATDTGRHWWITTPSPMPRQDGSIISLCSGLARSADDVSLLLGNVLAGRSRSAALADAGDVRAL